MRGKKHDVCHTCRQHKIGVCIPFSFHLVCAAESSQCDGLKPACSQCRLTGRECRGYLQDLVVFHHKPTARRRRPGSKSDDSGQCNARLCKKPAPLDSGSIDQQQPTYDECVAILVQHCIPKEEIPFLLDVKPSKSRIMLTLSPSSYQLFALSQCL